MAFTSHRSFRSFMTAASVMAAAWVMATAGSAQAASLKDDGYVGCLTEDALTQFIRAARKNDEQAMNYMLKVPLCVTLSSAFKVTTLKRSLSKSQIRVYVDDAAVDLWTVNEAFQR